MITPSTQSKLSLLLPNQNKVLSEIIKHATSDQIIQLNDKKDLRSLLGTLFQHKIDNTKSDALLLSMLKSSPSFKNMGNFTDTLKSLIGDLKSNPSLEGAANKLLRAVTPVQLDTSQQKIITTSDPLQSKNNQQSNSPLKQESPIQGDTIGQKVITIPDALQAKNNQQSNSPLKQELPIQGDKNIPNPIIPETKASLELQNTLEAKAINTDQSPSLQTNDSSTTKTLFNHDESVQSPLFELDAPILKEKIANSGVFMESKIATLEGADQEMVENQMGNDVKSQLLELSEELKASPSVENTQLQVKIDELLTHIDYHQLLSHLNNSNSLYFPFPWEGLEKGSISLKKSKKEKFYCEINLTLKEHGDVDLFMGLYNDNQLDIKIHTQKSEFKKLLQAHIDDLRTLLRDANLTLRAIRIFDQNERLTQSANAYESIDDNTHNGFEVKI